MKSRKGAIQSIKVDTLSRVEGEGSLYVKFKGDDIASLKFKIYEPPRLFEGFLRGRKYFEVPILPPGYAVFVRLPIK
jgi:sulfhydrogenase subunit alpha